MVFCEQTIFEWPERRSQPFSACLHFYQKPGGYVKGARNAGVHFTLDMIDCFWYQSGSRPSYIMANSP